MSGERRGERGRALAEAGPLLFSEELVTNVSLRRLRPLLNMAKLPERQREWGGPAATGSPQTSTGTSAEPR